MQGVILLIIAHVEKAPMTCFSSLYSFILRFNRLLIVSDCVNLIWRGRSFVTGALIIDDKCHPWTKGSGHTRPDRHHHWQSQQLIKLYRLLRQFLGVFICGRLLREYHPAWKEESGLHLVYLSGV